MTAAPDPLFLAAGDCAQPRRLRFGWAAILRALPRDAIRSRVLERYRAAGFAPDDFAHRSAARACMADCLTRAEDWIELEHPLWVAERAAIAAVRRPLELEIR
jgi:hypothetical protein